MIAVGGRTVARRRSGWIPAIVEDHRPQGMESKPCRGKREVISDCGAPEIGQVVATLGLRSVPFVAQTSTAEQQAAIPMASPSSGCGGTEPI